MTRFHTALRSGRRALPVATAAAAAAVAAFALVSPGAADAGSAPTPPAVPAPPASPTKADQIQNIDQVKTAIKAYYGDTPTSIPDPVNGATTLHLASPTSAYANEMANIERRAEAYLSDPTAGGKNLHPGKPAIVLDVDDTTLNTYSYEIYSNFVYNPTTNAAFVNAGVFPAVFGMPALVKVAKAEGYAIFYLTGRPESQRAATEANLQNVGYPKINDNRVYLKDLSAPWLASCATQTPSCTTDQYKSLTRQHIESLGYDIVGNFGDQFSDLSMGFADKDFKLPNPMYFLP
jgi:hypothetical protein